MKDQAASLWEKWKNQRGGPALAAILGGIAMLLIFLSELWPQSTSGEVTEATTLSALEYQTQLEQQLADLIGQMEGAGHTVVMITLESEEEVIYALDTQTGQTQTQQTHVLLENGTALEETVYLPTVCGAAIICDGGADVRVAARITELVGALLDLPANRICVEQRSG